jgi:hypothetical protein
MEKHSLSKVERYALERAREQYLIADAAFKEIMNEVGTAHGVAKGDGANWRFADDFSELIRIVPTEPPSA